MRWGIDRITRGSTSKGATEDASGRMREIIVRDVVRAKIVEPGGVLDRCDSHFSAMPIGRRFLNFRVGADVREGWGCII